MSPTPPAPGAAGVAAGSMRAIDLSIAGVLGLCGFGFYWFVLR